MNLPQVPAMTTDDKGNISSLYKYLWYITRFFSNSPFESILIPQRLTIAERNSLQPTNGMMIYNTTDNKFQGYEAGAWVNLV